MQPSRSARATGSGTSNPVLSSITEKTVDTGHRWASSLRQPVSRSATGLRNSTRPDVSTVITASAIEASVTCALSFSSKTCASVCLRSVMSVSEPAMRRGLPSGPSTERPRVRNQRYVPSCMRMRNSRSNELPVRRCVRRPAAAAWRSRGWIRRRNEAGVSRIAPGSKPSSDSKRADRKSCFAPQRPIPDAVVAGEDRVLEALFADAQLAFDVLVVANERGG